MVLYAKVNEFDENRYFLVIIENPKDYVDSEDLIVVKEGDEIYTGDFENVDDIVDSGWTLYSGDLHDEVSGVFDTFGNFTNNAELAKAENYFRTVTYAEGEVISVLYEKE